MAAFADAGAPKSRRKAARANKRVESNSGEFEALTIKGDLGATEDHGVAARISHG
jgi:hypothetical protein